MSGKTVRPLERIADEDSRGHGAPVDEGPNPFHAIVGGLITTGAVAYATLSGHYDKWMDGFSNWFADHLFKAGGAASTEIADELGDYAVEHVDTVTRYTGMDTYHWAVTIGVGLIGAYLIFKGTNLVRGLGSYRAKRKTLKHEGEKFIDGEAYYRPEEDREMQIRRSLRQRD